MLIRISEQNFCLISFFCLEKLCLLYFISSLLNIYFANVLEDKVQGGY